MAVGIVDNVDGPACDGNPEEVSLAGQVSLRQSPLLQRWHHQEFFHNCAPMPGHVGLAAAEKEPQVTRLFACIHNAPRNHQVQAAIQRIIGPAVDALLDLRVGAERRQISVGIEEGLKGDE
ncbi:hypothetical protein PspLS_06987 [Pyricularia sp. CBS 133598]|nr:hypothetical protein PspLS_06987 [Pyricularia sp. CBS 133598]